MKSKILIIFALLLTLNIIAETITDQLWLKAVDLKSKSLNIYPTQSKHKTEMKNKKGEVEMTEIITLAHKEVDGQIINSFVEGSNSEEMLDTDSDSVKRYLKQTVLVEDVSVFKTETSSDFSLERIDNDFIAGKEYAKYKVEMVSDTDDEDIKSKGFVWLDPISGIPFRLALDVDPNKMVVKSLDVVTDYSVSESGFLITDKVVTDVVISIVFKKMYISSTTTRKNYLKLDK